VCMYHDQGLIPLKLLHFFGGVGLPWITARPTTSRARTEPTLPA
jgi:4-hydroxy-L-threonine phosphate dehydrogenase PdxA